MITSPLIMLLPRTVSPSSFARAVTVPEIGATMVVLLKFSSASLFPASALAIEKLALCTLSSAASTSATEDSNALLALSYSA